MNTYIIAIRRDALDRVPPNWVQALTRIDGLTIVGRSANGQRVQVQASPRAIELASATLGGLAHIEPLISHAAV